MNRAFKPIVKDLPVPKVARLEVAVVATKHLFTLIFFSAYFAVSAQQNEELVKNYKVGEVEIDILGSYYQQDGDHSAVEGGDGSQELTDRVGSVILNIPFDTVNTFNVSLNFDSYTSASSSQIDWNDDEPAVSSPSYEDERVYGNFTYSRITEKNGVYSLGVGLSDEWDVFSHSYSAGWQKSFDNNNKTIGLDAAFIFDHWDLIYPTELSAVLAENGTGLNADLRQTYGLSASYTAVINKKIQAQLVYSYTFQKGLLSTPFHRVYFDTTGTNILIIEGNPIFGNVKRHPFVKKDIERLPSQKSKHAIGGRFNYHISNWLILRTFYRYYFDSFGIKSHTFSFELPIKPNRFFTVYPFFRFYQQTESDYFKPFLKHSTNDEFHTSDYDLSGFLSYKYGLGIIYSPATGIARIKNIPFNYRTSAFESVFIRLARYKRSDNLEAVIMSSGLSFSF